MYSGVLVGTAACRGGGGYVGAVSAFFLPNEKALPLAREDRDCDSGTAGIGMSCEPLCPGRGLSSRGVSVEEGRVDEELKRADAEELSLWPPLEEELFVPPLPLAHVRFATESSGNATYRLWGFGSMGLLTKLLSSKR